MSVEDSYVKHLTENLKTALNAAKDAPNPQLHETIVQMDALAVISDFESHPEWKIALDKHANWGRRDEQQLIRLEAAIISMQAEVKALELDLEDLNERKNAATVAKNVLTEATRLYTSRSIQAMSSRSRRAESPEDISDSISD